MSYCFLLVCPSAVTPWLHSRELSEAQYPHVLKSADSKLNLLCRYLAVCAVAFQEVDSAAIQRLPYALENTGHPSSKRICTQEDAATWMSCGLVREKRDEACFKEAKVV